jgi:hypothetical protein
MKLVVILLLVGLVAAVLGAPQETTHPPTTATTTKTTTKTTTTTTTTTATTKLEHKQEIIKCETEKEKMTNPQCKEREKREESHGWVYYREKLKDALIGSLIGHLFG